MLVEEVTLLFPDLPNPFHLYYDASDFELGATLVQEVNLVQLIYIMGE